MQQKLLNPVLIALFILVAINVNAQTNHSVKGPPEMLDFFFNFDGNDEEMLEFDTTGIWQVGTPIKEEWDTALNGTHVLMTDTVNMLNTPAKASVIFKWERPWWSNCISWWEILMKHKYELPDSTSGGYIEVSYNQGLNWTNIALDTLYNNTAFVIDDFKQQLFNGQYGIKGNRNEWGGEYEYNVAAKEFYPDSVAAEMFSIWLRFTYENIDTITHKGWMIDSLWIRISHNCEFISVEELENSKTRLYPNPITEESVLEFSNPAHEEFQFKAYDIIGRMVLHQPVFDEKVILNRSDFDNGYYLYRLTNGKDRIYTGKFIVE